VGLSLSIVGLGHILLGFVVSGGGGGLGLVIIIPAWFARTRPMCAIHYYVPGHLARTANMPCRSVPSRLQHTERCPIMRSTDVRFLAMAGFACATSAPSTNRGPINRVLQDSFSLALATSCWASAVGAGAASSLSGTVDPLRFLGAVVAISENETVSFFMLGNQETGAARPETEF